MKKLVVVIIILFASVLTLVKGQGYNHQWLLGNNPLIGFPNGRMLIDSNSYQLITEYRKMSFMGTEANISDLNGNLLMSSNGVWIANAYGDTMMNGGGLNPGDFANSWPYGFPLPNGNVVLPFPGDTSKLVLIHKSIWGQFSISPKAIYQSVIDLKLDSGLGAVIIKNDSLLSDTLSWGITACKHANGRDWWIIVVKDGNPTTYTWLLTPFGIQNLLVQNLNSTFNTYGNVSQITFSLDGSKFLYNSGVNQTQSGQLLIADFDRCSGFFNNIQLVSVSSNSYLWGLAFSPRGRYIYTCSSNYVYQIDTTSFNIDTVAGYDGFISPGPNCCATTFMNMYLAANGKIYITSGSSVRHLHEMNFPDSVGLSCDLQQHAIDYIDYLNFRTVPNHPNYYLGPVVGSVCDSLTGLNEHLNEVNNFSIRPNPNNGDFSITYLLPQGQPGWFEVYDVLGKQVFKMTLPSWSTLQSVQLPSIPTGIYNAVIRSGYDRVSKKIAVIKN